MGRKKTAVWSTGDAKSASGREFRTAYTLTRNGGFPLSFEVLRTKASVNELEQLAGFFNARKGSFESFRYEDPTDNAVTSQPIGNTVQGVTRYQLVRSMGGFIEPVLAVKERPAVKVGGVALTYGRDYSVTDKGVLDSTRRKHRVARLHGRAVFISACDSHLTQWILKTFLGSPVGVKGELRGEVVKTATKELIDLLHGSDEFQMAVYTPSTLSGGQVLRHTSADMPVVWDGQTYRSA